ncbi:hypothetical protein ACJX0J_009961 [Zea mays]
MPRNYNNYLETIKIIYVIETNLVLYIILENKCCSIYLHNIDLFGLEHVFVCGLMGSGAKGGFQHIIIFTNGFSRYGLNCLKFAHHLNNMELYGTVKMASSQKELLGARCNLKKFEKHLNVLAPIDLPLEVEDVCDILLADRYHGLVIIERVLIT